MGDEAAFKKRKRPQLRQQSDDGADAEGSEASNTADGRGVESQGDEAVNLAADARELQRLRKRASGISAERLMETVDKDAKKAAKEAATAAAAEDPFKLKTGGLVETTFTKQTNALDVDKHMVAYVEQEMKKKRGLVGDGSANAPVDPMDELYKLPEHVQQQLRKKGGEPAKEGDASTSSAMLITIPEIDLGVEAKMKNIEETERARQAALDQQQQQQQPQSKNYVQNKWFATNKQDNFGNRDQATDDLIVERFKKREMANRNRR